MLATTWLSELADSLHAYIAYACAPLDRHTCALAGSERQKQAATAGTQLREAASINKSLSTLGLVIMSLVDQQRGGPRHVPFRDSKLTFLLQVGCMSSGLLKPQGLSAWSLIACCATRNLHAAKHVLLLTGVLDCTSKLPCVP